MGETNCFYCLLAYTAEVVRVCYNLLMVKARKGMVPLHSPSNRREQRKRMEELWHKGICLSYKDQSYQAILAQDYAWSEDLALGLLFLFLVSQFLLQLLKHSYSPTEPSTAFLKYTAFRRLLTCIYGQVRTDAYCYLPLTYLLFTELKCPARKKTRAASRNSSSLNIIGIMFYSWDSFSNTLGARN